MLVHAPQERDTWQAALQQAIEVLAAQWPTYGYRRITRQLQREGWPCSPAARSRATGPAESETMHDDGQCRSLSAQSESGKASRDCVPEQVWVCDITYIRLREEFVYLGILMDVFTRCIRGWHLSRHLDQSLILQALEQAMTQHTPQIHHSDQGVQYAATAYTTRLQEAGVRISMAEVGAAWQNGYAERLMRTIKEEEVDLSEYADYADAVSHLERFLNEVYMHKRIHSSLGYLTLAEFEQQWRSQQALLQLD